MVVLFEDLEIGELFVFEYEAQQIKNNEFRGYFMAYGKTGATTYSSTHGFLIKKFPAQSGNFVPEIKGCSYESAEVRRVDLNGHNPIFEE